MKNIKNIRKETFLFGFLIAVAFLTVSCDKFLDETPDNRVELNTLDKASQVLTNAYSISSYAFTDWMTDNVGFIIGTELRMNHRQAYSWEDFTDGPTQQDTPIFFWFETYQAIAHANEVLASLNDLSASSEEDIAKKKAIESEALLARAYGHFMLVNLFGKHYDEETADTDLGVPYIDKPETIFIQKYTRNTVKEVYDFVEKDMLRGIELVDDSFFANSGKYHFNRNAALAFASRFYLFKGDHAECIKYCDEMFGTNPSVFVRDFNSDEYQSASASIEGYPSLYASPDEQANLLLMRKISLVQRLDFAHGPVDTEYGDLFNSHPFDRGVVDNRENPAFVKGDNGLFPVRYQSLFERSSLNSNTGFPYHIALAFRGEEVLFNRAESYIIQNRVNDAIADLQIITDKRYDGGSTVLTLPNLRQFFGLQSDDNRFDRDLLLEYLLLEKRKEYLVEGLRWFDIKRLKIEVSHTFPDGTSIILNEEDNRKVFQIPQSAIDVSGLEPNPR